MKTKPIFRCAVFLISILTLGSIYALAQKNGNRILVFSKTAGFYHNSIKAGNAAILKLGAENKFLVDTTTDASKFSADNLKQYAAIVFLNTTGDVLNNEQQDAFEKYIKNGGGFAGIHAATDCEYNWPWYGNLVGAYFGGHPAVQEASLTITDPKHISTKGLPQPWKHRDEWYNFKWMATGLHVLITIDETSYKGGTMGASHPMAWYHDYDGGRAFYTELGHTDAAYSDPLYLGHILGGLQYAMGAK